MFSRRRSVHGRLMGSVRSAQQKCVRRGLLEPLILLNIEHLLSEPDMSRAALSRMQVIAAEDVGAGCLGLLPALMALEKGWRSLDKKTRARRLIQASHLCANAETSRFLPCWLVSLIKGVEVTKVTGHWRSFEVLLSELGDSLKSKDLRRAGLVIEEIFLRHPIGNETPLPSSVGLPRSAMAKIWAMLLAHCPADKQLYVEACRKRFGPPSRESVAARLFLYLGLLCVLVDMPGQALTIKFVTDREVASWLGRAEGEKFAFPDWVFDRQTRRGKSLGRGYTHFFDEATRLANPSSVLGLGREREARMTAKNIYIEEENLFGKASTANIRRRWRAAAAEVCAENGEREVKSFVDAGEVHGRVI